MAADRIIALAGGSLRAGSYTLASLKAAAEEVSRLGFTPVLLDVRALNLPMYRPDFDSVDDYPADVRPAVQQVVDTLRAATGFIFASPVYHGTVSGVFKNLVDYAEYLSGDSRPYLYNCPIGLITTNDARTFDAMMHIVHELRGWVAPTQVVISRAHFSPDRVLTDERTKNRISRLVGELAGFLA
jgi:FMN reductase